MDTSDTWLLNALQGILPENTLHLLHEHVLSPTSPLAALRGHVNGFLGALYTLLSPVLAPLAARLAQALHDSPDLVVLGFVLGFLFLAVQVMAFVQRTVMAVTRLVFRLLFWSAVAALVAALWQRGPEAAARDVVVVVSKVAGYVAVIREVWWSEYQKYDAQTRGSAAATGGRQGYGQSRLG
ncbi:hypothetical protein F4780DRAFT_739007 [Xylariomycetidae sp. FL0641]|nr:hypothetical protein F4780DRAFT_739007 [Xylariomycetidae sp. FL0641]